MKRAFAAGLMALALMASPARAEWREYTYPDLGFAIAFPDDPKVEEGSYDTGTGAQVSARIYSLEAPGGVFRVTVADYSRSNIGENAAIDGAVKALSALGQVTVNEFARVNQVYGRDLSIVAGDGRRISAALFWYRDRLYRIEGSVPPDGDFNAIRFQQSLRFTNFGARIPSFFDLFGFNRR